MAERPHYWQYCPLSMAAGVIGTRWTLLILRELLDVFRIRENQEVFPAECLIHIMG